MAMPVPVSAKRPYDARPQVDANFIDLTSDNEDERPSKRQRSQSYTGPPVPNDRAPNRAGPSPGSLHAAAVRNGTLTNIQPPAHINNLKPLPKQSLTPQYATPVLKPEASTPGVKQAQRPNGLSNGINNLSIRSSPRPREGQQLVNKPDTVRKSRSPSIVVLDDDSDTFASARSRQTKSQPRKSTPLRSPVRYDDLDEDFDIKLDDWKLPKAKPLIFDTTSTESRASASIRSPNAQPPLESHVTKPIVQVPSRSLLNITHASRPIQTATQSAPRHVVQSSQPTSSPSKPMIRINVPAGPVQVKAAVDKLKGPDGIRYFKKNAIELAEITGVLPFDDIDHEEQKVFRKAAQKKARSGIDRASIKLDLPAATPPISSAKTLSEIIHPRTQARRILKARFQDTYAAPLTFSNRTTRLLHGKFQFVTNYVYSRGVSKKKQAPLPPRICQCIDGCDVDCPCAAVRERSLDGKLITSLPGLQAYQRRPNGPTVLSDAFVKSWTGYNRIIYECGEFCTCAADCVNHVVRNGRILPLEIFETQHCGFGVKSSKDILRGQFIDVYLGEVLTTTEVERREAAADEDTPSYFMMLDVFVSEEHSQLHIDGANFGSVTRFVNHSCNPNAKTIPVVLANDTKHIYHVAFFAIRDIPAGTEITIDYDPDLNQDRETQEGQDEAILDSAIVQCRCGSANCRKRLWMPGKAKRARKRVLPLKDDD